MAKMSTPLRVLLIVAVVAGGLLLPLWLRGRPSGERPPAPAEETDHRIPVGVGVGRASRLEERLSATGTILADERVEIVSEIAGKVEAVTFDEGGRVAAGTVLVRLDTATLAAERDRARFRFELTQRQEERERKLLEEGLISQETYDATVSELNVLGSDLELRQAILDKAEIRAPFTGRVGLRAISKGAFVTPQTRVAPLQVLDPVKIEFSVPESYARQVQPGASVRFRVQGLEEGFTGTVYAVEPVIDPDTRSLTLRARAPNPAGNLVPGAFAEVELAVREAPEALSVPAIAVIPELGGKKVFVLDEGRAVARPVRTGIRTESRVEIVEGLEEGEEVIVSNVARLTAGVEVKVTDERAGGRTSGGKPSSEDSVLPAGGGSGVPGERSPTTGSSTAGSGESP